MNTQTETLYSIPARYRKMENMHIIFWLFKDISWCMIWKPVGIAMIFPTLIISIVIVHRTRNITSELASNLAVTFWISANSYWMISEFFGFDTTEFLWGIQGKYFSIIPFAIGISILAYYYMVQKPGETKRNTATL